MALRTWKGKGTAKGLGDLCRVLLPILVLNSGGLLFRHRQFELDE